MTYDARNICLLYFYRFDQCKRRAFVTKNVVLNQIILPCKLILCEIYLMTLWRMEYMYRVYAKKRFEIKQNGCKCLL